MTAKVISFSAAAGQGRPGAVQRELFPRPAWAVPSLEEVGRERQERLLAWAERLLAEGRRGPVQGELALRWSDVVRVRGSRVRVAFRRE